MPIYEEEWQQRSNIVASDQELRLYFYGNFSGFSGIFDECFPNLHGVAGKRRREELESWTKGSRCHLQCSPWHLRGVAKRQSVSSSNYSFSQHGTALQLQCQLSVTQVIYHITIACFQLMSFQEDPSGRMSCFMEILAHGIVHRYAPSDLISILNSQ